MLTFWPTVGERRPAVAGSGLRFGGDAALALYSRGAAVGAALDPCPPRSR
jgi:hypothetical protein